MEETFCHGEWGYYGAFLRRTRILHINCQQGNGLQSMDIYLRENLVLQVILLLQLSAYPFNSFFDRCISK
jgi:hypothetical protein